VDDIDRLYREALAEKRDVATVTRSY